ncbi:hypothetical protein [Neobacillus mesonae]|uniref:hypothetical protein n=1 Tax=Neobacillus mesonae TaxID=1193713 RepID=UPI00203F467F|nr:hypothetical protein [Neobacillus mesonae]MCM3571075.1 hypothetical protein [Neobacillus mesonae]
MALNINIGTINVNTPQQNGVVFVGQNIVTGMDANMKSNSAHGGTFGLFDIVTKNYNINLDNFELADGNINDQNIKTNSGNNI